MVEWHGCRGKLVPRIYRSMRADDGMPAIGRSAVCLGVRIPEDIQPDQSGQVQPGTGGMSVAPALRDLPIHRIPRRLQAIAPGAKGSESLRVWRMGDGP